MMVISALRLGATNQQKRGIILWRLLTQTIESVLSSTTIILLSY